MKDPERHAWHRAPGGGGKMRGRRRRVRAGPRGAAGGAAGTQQPWPERAWDDVGRGGDAERGAGVESSRRHLALGSAAWRPSPPGRPADGPDNAATALRSQGRSLPASISLSPRSFAALSRLSSFPRLYFCVAWFKCRFDRFFLLVLNRTVKVKRSIIERSILLHGPKTEHIR